MPSDPFYDPHKPLKTTKGGNLPHWHQDGKLQFVTFRLADSLPAPVIAAIRTDIDRFNKQHPQPWDADTQREYRTFIGHLEEKQLDKGLGSCILRSADAREILADTIRLKDGTDYIIYACVIMPNHVHMLIQPLGSHELSRIMYEIKRSSAILINKRFGRTGKLWQSESFDRLVRSPAHLDNCLDYIKANPHGLPPHHFTLYLRQ